MKYLRDTKDVSLRMRKLEFDSLHIRSYADASFATNAYLNLQLVYIVVLSDKDDSCCVLHYASYKSGRAARFCAGFRNIFVHRRL